MLRKGRSKNEEWSATNRGNSKKQYTRKDNKKQRGLSIFTDSTKQN